MKNILIGTGVGLLANIAVAQELMLPMECYPLDQMEKIINSYEETTGFVGRSKASDGTDVVTMIVRNEDTGSWTNMLINTTADAACIVSFGDGFQFIYGGDAS
jgi:hypothetical protein